MATLSAAGPDPALPLAAQQNLLGIVHRVRDKLARQIAFMALPGDGSSAFITYIGIWSDKVDYRLEGW